MSGSAKKKRKVEGGSVSKSWMKECFDNFEAELADVNDQSESCAAKLHFVDDHDEQLIIMGATGKCGHAEMHALTQFIRNECQNDENRFAEFQARGLHIECPAKSCCQRCSIVLGALNIAPIDGDYTRTLFKIVNISRRVHGKTVIRKVKEKTGSLLCHGETYKVEKSMGSTEWGLPPDIRGFLAGWLQKTGQEILSIGSLAGY